MNDLCPSAKKCYRYMAEPSPQWQAYMEYKPLPGKDECGNFWPLRDAFTPLRKVKPDDKKAKKKTVVRR